jgi:histidinol phosphatase-like PHP family hydrolase
MEVAGSRFWKLDLHVHTPASTDFNDKDATPNDVVNAALAAGLQAMAVTDHNSPNWIELIRAVAFHTDLTVFPGFEVNTQGGHVLAIFDPSTKIEVIETALIESGIPKPRWADNEIVGHDIATALAAIDRNGGLAVAAHADGPKGFLTAIGQGIARIQVYKNPHLSALELTSEHKRSDFLDGKVPGYDRPMACIQGSDAHSLAEIGKRFVYLRMHGATIEGLRQACAEPLLRIRLAADYSSPEYARIERISVDRGFLQGEEIRFNPSLNCLVGGAGSGKSTVIEFLRFALDQISAVEPIAQDAVGKLRDLAGTGATISVDVILDSGDRLRISREFDEDTNPIRITELSTGDEIEAADVRSLFPVHAYSQGEVVSISRNPLAQLELIDSHIAMSQYQSDVSSAYQALSRQTEGLVKLEAITRDRDGVVKQIAAIVAMANRLTSELESLEQAQKSIVVASHQHWVAEEAYFRGLLAVIEPTRSSIKEVVQSMELPLLDVPLPSEATPSKDLLQRCVQAASDLEQARSDAEEVLLQRLGAVQKEIHAIYSEWQKTYESHMHEYEMLEVDKKSARAAQINAQLSSHRKNLQNLNAKLKSIDAADRTLQNQLKERNRLLDLIKDCKARIFALRDKKAKEIAKEIGDIIALALIPDGNRSRHAQVLTQVLQGTYAPRPVVERIAAAFRPMDLAALLRMDDARAIDDESDVGVKWAQALVDQVHAHPGFLYEIEGTSVEDRIEISFKVALGEYRTLEKLSTGQKATVIVLLTMVEGNNPIIFDQPEDALYTPSIYTDVVKALRREKDQRQFILATHNPNIAVGGDADLGIVLEGTSTQASVQAAGGLDDEVTQGLLLWHLEGGEQALRSRSVKFGLR